MKIYIPTMGKHTFNNGSGADFIRTSMYNNVNLDMDGVKVVFNKSYHLGGGYGRT